MKVNIGTRVATVNFVFLSHNIIHSTPSLYIEGTKSLFTSSNRLACLSTICADQRQHLNPDFLLKTVKITLQTCVDIANEYLHAYNIGAGVKNHLFCSLHKCKGAGYTMFLLKFVFSNYLFQT